MSKTLKLISSILKEEVVIRQADADERTSILPEANENVAFQKLQDHLHTQGFSEKGELRPFKVNYSSGQQSLSALSLIQEYQKFNSNETAILKLCLRPNGSTTATATVHRQNEPYCWFDVDSNGEIQVRKRSFLSRVQSPILKVMTAVSCGVWIAVSPILRILRRSDS